MVKHCHGAVIPMETHTFDDNTGKFEGYATVYGVPIDRPFGQVVMDPGLFSDSIKRQGAENIRLLWQHNTDEPIGVYEELREDSKGVFVQGRLLVEEIARAKEVYSLMKNKAIGGLSVGFGVLEQHTDKDSELVHYTKGELFEVSAVTFPANVEAKVSRVHSADFKSIRDFEEFLREAGFSRKDATVVASKGFNALQRDAEDEQEILQSIKKLQQTLKGISYARN